MPDSPAVADRSAAPPGGSRSRLGQWEQRTGPFLTIAALAFLAGYAVPIIWPDVPGGVRLAARGTLNLAWACFGADYVTRLVLAEDRRRFVQRHVVDLLAVALPLVRPLALLKVVAAISVLKRVGASTLRGRVLTFVTGGTALLVIVGGLAITDAERGRPGANIAGFTDGLWWAITTITTVGYGDRFPVTPMGRVIAIGLMIAGIALLGVITATLASWFVERIADDGATQEAATRAQVDALAEEVRALRTTLNVLVGEAQGPSSAGSTRTDEPQDVRATCMWPGTER